MQKNILETIMGGVVLLVAALFLVFAYNSSDMRVNDGYTIRGNFASAAGIALGSDVRIGGIKVGVVSNLDLDPKTYEAVVSMNIQSETKLPKDSSASIVSNGLLGEKYIQLVPGADDANLKEGGNIEYTQSSVNLEEMIGKFMFSGGGVDKDKTTATP